MDYEDALTLVRNLSGHCPNLASLGLPWKYMGGSLLMELAVLYKKLGQQLTRSTINDMVPDILTRVVKACPNLRRNFFIEVNFDLERASARQRCAINLRLTVVLAPNRMNQMS